MRHSIKNNPENPFFLIVSVLYHLLAKQQINDEIINDIDVYRNR